MTNRMADLLFEIVVGRRSIRSYTSDEVPDEAIRRIIESGHWAPTPGNIQSWRFIVVRRQLGTLKSLSPGFPNSATAAIVVCSDLRAMRRYSESVRPLRVAEEAAMAAENMLLMAHAMKLGACAVAAFSKDACAELLKLPEHIHPALVVALGVPAEAPIVARRKETELITSWETYRPSEADCAEET
jgi:nitroreductase